MLDILAFGVGGLLVVLHGLLGLLVGSYIFSFQTPKKYFKFLDLSSDRDEDVVAPEDGAPVPYEMRKLLPFTEPWTQLPDIERVTMLNRILETLWPTIAKAGVVQALQTAKTQLTGILAQYPYVEDVLLGTASMKDVQLDELAEQWVKDKEFTIGSHPPRLAGIKSYNTPDDEVMLETPIIWGSNSQFDISVILRFGLFRLYVPIQISNLHFKVATRVTLKPLVEDMPCVGGLSVCLMEVPYINMGLKLFKGVDLMALPGAEYFVNKRMQHVLSSTVLYPCTIDVPIMPNFGVPSTFKGALKVKLLRGVGLGGSYTASVTYVKMFTRATRKLESKPVYSPNSSPEFGEEFTFLVTDFEEQVPDPYDPANENPSNPQDPRNKGRKFTRPKAFHMSVFSTRGERFPIGVGQLDFGEMQMREEDDMAEESQLVEEFVLADFIKVPRKEHDVRLKLYPPSEPAGKKEVTSTTASVSSQMSAPARSKSVSSAFSTKKQQNVSYDRGTLHLKVTYTPFFQPSFDDEGDASSAAKAITKIPRRVVTHNVPDSLKGVLTVGLIRCINLKTKSPEPDIYVQIRLSDPELHTNYPDATSKLVSGEVSPRFGAKFEFVSIPAGCNLYITVFEKGAKSAKSIVGRRHDAAVGTLYMRVKDIARNGMLKDVWTLMETERGQIELKLTWMTCYVAE